MSGQQQQPQHKSKRKRKRAQGRSEGSNDEDSSSSSDESYTPEKGEIDQEPPCLPPKPPSSTVTEKAVDVSPTATSSCLTWSSLPYELLFKIFDHLMSSMKGDVRELKILEQVCHAWRNVAQDRRLWYHVNLAPLLFKRNASKGYHSFLKLALNRQSDLYKAINSNYFRYTKRLDISYLPCFTCDDLNVLLSHCDPMVLTELALIDCKKINHTTSNLVIERVIADHCPNLASLNMTQMHKRFKHHDICYLFEKLNRNLRVLNMAQNFLNSKMFTSLFDNCSNLEKLDISNSNSQDEFQIDFDFMASKCPKLRSFQMLNCYPRQKYNTFEEALNSPVGFTNLQELNIAMPASVGSEAILKIMTKMCKDSVNLKTLDIRYYRCHGHFNVFEYISANKLENLFMCHSVVQTQIEDLNVRQAIIKWSKSLVNLDMSWSNISKESFDAIIDSFVENPDECSLAYLNLTGTCVDSEMIKKLKQLKSLRIINLTSCRSVDRGMKQSFSVESFPKLFGDE